MGERAYPGDISPSNSDKTAFSPSSVSNAATSACRSSFSTGPSCSASLGEAEAVVGEAEARLMRARFQSSASVAGISEIPSGAHDRSPMRNAWKHTPRSCSAPEKPPEPAGVSTLKTLHYYLHLNPAETAQLFPLPTPAGFIWETCNDSGTAKRCIIIGSDEVTCSCQCNSIVDWG